MSYNFPVGKLEEYPEWDVSWCNTGCYCWSTSDEKYIEDGRDWVYTAYTPPIIDQIKTAMEEGANDLCISAMFNPGLFPHYSSESFTFTEDSIIIESIVNFDNGNTSKKKFTMPIDVFFKGVELIEAYRERMKQENTPTIRPAGGAFGAYYDDIKGKIIGGKE